MNLRPSGYEPDELPGCSTPRRSIFLGIVRRDTDLRLFPGLAVTYSPTSWDAVPSAQRRLTAEFGMGSGVSLALMPPNLQNARGEGFGPSGLASRAHTRLSFAVTDLGSMTSAGKGTSGPPASGSDQAYRAISTGQLNALLRLHLRPIDVVVFHGPQGRPGFEGGFPLRCLQRLSCPHIATQHCRWHDNWSTSGTFTPVLSY